MSDSVDSGSELREQIEERILPILESFYHTAVQDADGVRAGRKSYVMRYDELPARVAQEIATDVESLVPEITKLIIDNLFDLFEEASELTHKDEGAE